MAKAKTVKGIKIHSGIKILKYIYDWQQRESGCGCRCGVMDRDSAYKKGGTFASGNINIRWQWGRLKAGRLAGG